MSSSRFQEAGLVFRTPSLIAAGRPRRFCTTTLSASHRRPIRGRAAGGIQRCRAKSCSGRTSGWAGFHLAHDEECQFHCTAIISRAIAHTAQAGTWTGWLLPQATFRGTPVNLLANVDPDMNPKTFGTVHQDKEGAAEISLKNLDAAAAKEV